MGLDATALPTAPPLLPMKVVKPHHPGIFLHFAAAIRICASQIKFLKLEQCWITKAVSTARFESHLLYMLLKGPERFVTRKMTPYRDFNPAPLSPNKQCVCFLK